MWLLSECRHAFCLQGTHYRAAVNYTQRALEEASERLYSIYQAVRSAFRLAYLLHTKLMPTSQHLARFIPSLHGM